MGRRRNEFNPAVAREDEIIARTVHDLMMWGFPQRRKGAFQAVARAIEDMNFFGDNFRERSVGANRVEQIYKAWRSKMVKHSGWPYLYQRGRFTRRSLVLRSPGGSIDELARNLLKNKGSWASSYVWDLGSAVTESVQLTPRAQAEFDQMPRLKRSPKRHRPLLHAVKDIDGRLSLVRFKRGSKSSSS